MAVSVQMPKQGNTVEECLIVEWKVKEGDSVKTGDALCSIETDKASFEVESTADGVVLKLLANAGDLVPVLTDIAVIGQAGESVAAAAPATSTSTPASAPSAPAASAPAQPAQTQASVQPAQNAAQPGEFKPVSPRARKLAEKLGVDAAAIYGSGIYNRVIAKDVQNAVDSGSAVKASPLAREIMAEKGLVAGGGSGIGGLCRARDLVAERRAAALPKQEAKGPEIVQYKGIRKLIGDRMHQSLQQHAQLTLNASATATGLMALRKIYKENAEAVNLPNISINDLICWVVAQTLPSFPEVNAIIDKTAGTITRYSTVNLAFAVDTPRGLMVPVIENAQDLSLAELSRTIASYAEECRKGSINPDLLQGGTFTISNLGGMGIESFTPVLNSPQVAILGVCAIQNVPTPKGDSFVFTPKLGLSLTIDHQAVDGAPGARFLQAVAKGIEAVQTTLALYGAF